MVMVLAAQLAVTPVGKPVATPMPVAPVVVCVILVINVLIHKVGDNDAALTVLFGVTVTVKVVGVPMQPLAVGVIVYTAVPEEELVAV
jgi:sorbitol-specific phosphotransferase system component IIC